MVIIQQMQTECAKVHLIQVELYAELFQSALKSQIRIVSLRTAILQWFLRNALVRVK